jgi:hypothetical protein
MELLTRIAISPATKITKKKPATNHLFMSKL